MWASFAHLNLGGSRTLLAFALCRSGRDGDANSLSPWRVLSAHPGDSEMTFWNQGILEEALVISCPLCHGTCGAPLDPLDFTGELFLFSCWLRDFACSMAGLCPLLAPGWDGLLGCPGCSAKLGSFQRRDNLIFGENF